MRILLEIALWVVAIALLLTVGKGLGPVSGIARALFSPVAIGLLIAFFFLLRWRRSSSAPDRSSPS